MSVWTPDQIRKHSHEEGEKLHDVLQELALATDVDQSSEANLSDDSCTMSLDLIGGRYVLTSQLARGSADSVCGGSVSGREDLTGDDYDQYTNEGPTGPGHQRLSCWGQSFGTGWPYSTAVSNEASLPIATHQEDERLLASTGLLHLVVAEAHADEDDGEDGEAHELDLLTAPRVDEDEGQVVSRDETADSQNNVSDGDVVQRLVRVDRLGGAMGVRAEADRGQDGRRVETET